MMTKMKSILVNDFCPDVCVDAARADDQIKKNIVMGEAKKPVLDGKRDKTKMIIRVSACSLAPGDTHMLRGNIAMLLPKRFPYVPGMAVCGVVEEIHPSVVGKIHPSGIYFEVGDRVVCEASEPIGGLAEYMKVNVAKTLPAPPGVGDLDAASCWSAVTSWNALKDYVKRGDRVLILGGSGGVGSAALAMAKEVAGASFVATTSTQSSMCKELGADVVLNYNKINWWEVPEYQEKKFDVIIDTVGGGNFTGRAAKVLKTRKKGGTFVAVCGDDPIIHAETWWKMMKFLFSLPLRPLYTWCFRSSNPGYVVLLPKDEVDACYSVLNLMREEKLKIRLDPSSPLPFTEEGVRKAFSVISGRHAHGKVVVDMRKK